MATKAPPPARSRLRAPYEVMCKVLGHPTHHPASGERVAWDVDVDGARARIADHKSEQPQGSNIFEALHVTWRVEASDDEQLAWICSTLSERVIAAAAARTGARTLTTEDKAALNGLLRAGVPLAEAMKRVRTQLVDGEARSLYQWPMKDAPPSAALAYVHGSDDDSDDDSDEDEEESLQHASVTAVPKPSALALKLANSKGPLGPPMPADLPRSTIEAPFEKMRALLGDPEDRPIPFVSTRWRFVLDVARAAGHQIVRHEDEPRDDVTDVDAAIFDRIGRYDQPFASRSTASFTWTVTSSATENVERVLAWLDENLPR